MDQIKIGKLISKMRRMKGLTQRELGDKVGVGYRAVSKWETGMTSPDISIINELSQILGISSDELLNGELNESNKNNEHNQRKTKSKLFLILIPLFILIILILFKINNNKTYTYKLKPSCIDCSVSGSITFKNNNLATILINELRFSGDDQKNFIIKDYQYEIYFNDSLLLGYGYGNDDQTLSKHISIANFYKNFNISFDKSIKINRSAALKKPIILKIIFLTEDEREITKEIELHIGKK